MTRRWIIDEDVVHKIKQEDLIMKMFIDTVRQSCHWLWLITNYGKLINDDLYIRYIKYLKTKLLFELLLVVVAKLLFELLLVVVTKLLFELLLVVVQSVAGP